MTQADLIELLNEQRFRPFVVVTHDGYALAIGPEERKHIVAGKRMFVTLDRAGDIVHIPYSSIAHLFPEPQTASVLQRLYNELRQKILGQG